MLRAWGQPMRPIRLPEPAIKLSKTPEIFESGFYGVIKRAIIIGNGFAGAENQCIGLVRAVGLSGRHSIYRVTRPRGGINEWLHWLPISLHKKVDYFITQVFGYSQFQLVAPETSGLSQVLEADARQIAKMAYQTFEREGPLLVVASGRDTISVASSIKRLAPENVFVVQIQHPRTHLNRFDMVITPCHDYYPLTPHAQEQIPWFLRRWITPREPPDQHVVLTVGALHQADSAALRSAASVWHDELAVLPKPLFVVNVGGPTSNCTYGVDLAKQLTAMLQGVIWSCGSVRVSFSRRTPEKVAKIIVNEFSNNPKVFIWNGEDPNPHMGHLAWADAFLITADSVSMLSEACSTGKPVYVIGAERCTWKFAYFQKSLQERGVVRPFTGKEDRLLIGLKRHLLSGDGDSVHNRLANIGSINQVKFCRDCFPLQAAVPSSFCRVTRAIDFFLQCPRSKMQTTYKHSHWTKITTTHLLFNNNWNFEFF